MELVQKMQEQEIKREKDCVEYGNLRDRDGQYDKAIKAYDHALQINPDDADALFDKGITLKKMGKDKEAANYIETAINLYVGR